MCVCVCVGGGVIKITVQFLLLQSNIIFKRTINFTLL